MHSAARGGSKRNRPLAEASAWIDGTARIWEANYARLDALLDQLQRVPAEAESAKRKKEEGRDDMEHDTEKGAGPPAERSPKWRWRRDFIARRELVYEAYTNPKLVQRWLLGPPGWTMPVCEMDVRVGGKYRWRWRSDEDGKEFGFHGEPEKSAPLSRLVHTEFYDPGDVGGDMGDGALITG